MKKNFEDLFCFLFLENTCTCVLGLKHFCPWPRKGLSSEGLSGALGLASDFFCVLGLVLGFFFRVLGLGLKPSVLDSTSAEYPHWQDQYSNDNFTLFGCHAKRIVEKGKSINVQNSFCPHFHFLSLILAISNDRSRAIARASV